MGRECSTLGDKRNAFRVLVEKIIKKETARKT
jgi:hypothetical protein